MPRAVAVVAALLIVVMVEAAPRAAQDVRREVVRLRGCVTFDRNSETYGLSRATEIAVPTGVQRTSGTRPVYWLDAGHMLRDFAGAFVEVTGTVFDQDAVPQLQAAAKKNGAALVELASLIGEDRSPTPETPVGTAGVRPPTSVIKLRLETIRRAKGTCQ